MTDEPGDVRAGAGSGEDGSAAPSAEIVVVERRVPVVPANRWGRRAAVLRHRLNELRRHPAAVATVSAATTVGGVLLINGLRQAVQMAATGRLAPAGPTARSTDPTATGSRVIGYILHEVHVIHHVVPRPGRPGEVEVYTRQR